MREIKFRGKRKDTGEWVEGSLLKIDDRCFIIPKTFFDCLRDENYIKFLAIYNWHEIIPEIVGQYTGLKDKNGKEIYEGDIITTDGEIFAEIYWEESASGWMFRDIITGNIYVVFQGTIPESYMIVGNIFDNPELLEVEK